ncbi:MAG: T9SS type A sorting domain-containing protein [Bacteroidetes bacterium]|nr:T9SS type A sorting domain-containing protein [Bacteroidota bacterium]
MPTLRLVTVQLLIATGLFALLASISFAAKPLLASTVMVPEQSSLCERLANWKGYAPSNWQEARMQYDTLRMYVENCAATDPLAYLAFPDLDGDMRVLAVDTTIYNQYRDWLVSVLNLGAQGSAYYCRCLGSIAGTYQHYKGYDPTICNLAVLEYIRDHSPCTGGSGLDSQISKDSIYAWQHGQDPSHSIPLDSLGLGFLLTNGVKTPSVTPTSTFLSSFASSPNPFVNETELSFTLNRMTYVTISIYDELGRMVWGDGKGRSLDAGSHTIRIDGTSLPSGTLYARISTGFGEVKTVKLVHQE